MSKLTVPAALLGMMLLAACGSSEPQKTAAADVPAAEVSTTTTTTAAAVAAPAPVATATAPPAKAATPTTTPKPAAAKPAPVATTTTTATAPPTAEPATTTTTAVAVVETTTTTVAPAPAGSCSVGVAKPTLAYAEEQTVMVTSNQPGLQFRVEVISSTGSPMVQYFKNLPTDGAGSGSYAWKVMRSTVPVKVKAQFYDAAGQLTGPSCSTSYTVA